MILYPFLICLYPIFFLYSHNIKEVYFSQIIVPSLISLFITTATYLVLRKFTNSRFIAGFLTTVFIVIIFYYSQCFDALQSFGIFIPSYKHHYIILYVLVVWGYLIYFLRGLSNSYLNATKFLNIISILLIFANLYSIIAYELKVYNDFHDIYYTSVNKVKNYPLKHMGSNEKKYPDIYFIILDEYASSSTIKDIYNHDNSNFENYLIKKGFFVAKDSETSTSLTPAVIASILNMRRIDTNDLKTCFNLIKKNKVTRFLKNKNYKLINFPIRYYEDKVTPIMDSFMTFKSPRKDTIYQLSKFDLALFKSSIINSFYFAIDNKKKKDDKKLYYIESTNFIFRKLEEMINVKGPKFIYSHIECPHPPYVFKRNGDPLDNVEWNGIRFYLDQYIYITKKTQKIVEAILNKSKIPPIIIIQSDHGPNQKKEHTDAYFGSKEKHTKNIFNALFLPGINTEKLPQNISPEDTFKIVFSHYFDEI